MTRLLLNVFMSRPAQMQIQSGRLVFHFGTAGKKDIKFVHMACGIF